MVETPKLTNKVSQGSERVLKALEPLRNRGPRVEACGMCLALVGEQEE
jgi:hypothetical protein